MTGQIDSKTEFDLALSSLLQYGFSKVRIKRTIANILKLYNGKEAWPLIKENGYEAVLERLLSDDGPKRSKLQGKGAGNAGHAEKRSRLCTKEDNRVGQLGSDKEVVLHSAYAEEQGKPLPDGEGVLEVDCAGHVQEQSKSCPAAVDERVVHAFNVKSGDLTGPSSSGDVAGHSCLPADIGNSDIHSHQIISWSRDAPTVLTPPWLAAATSASKKVHQKLLHLNNLADLPAPQVVERCPGHGAVGVGGGVEKSKKGEQGSRKKRELSVVSEEYGPNYTGLEKNQNEQALGQGAGIKKQDFGSEELETRATIQIKPPSTAFCLEKAKECETLGADQPEAPGAVEEEGMDKRKWVSAHPVLSVPSKQFGSRATAQAKAHRTTYHPAAETKESEPPTMVDQASVPNHIQGLERLDIARISACKLTRRRDGAPNPMFSRLQKLKQASAGTTNRVQHGRSSSRAENQKRADHSVSNSGNENDVWEGMSLHSEKNGIQQPVSLNRSEGKPSSTKLGIQQHASPHMSEDKEESPKLPPGCWQLDDKQESPKPPSECWKSACKDYNPLTDDSPTVPPGCWEPSDCLSEEESPELPPGFWEPCGDNELGAGLVAKDTAEEHNEGLQSERSPPYMPPGFWKHSDTSGSAHGSGESSSCLWMASSRAEGLSMDEIGSKGTPPKQIFIANIPEGCEGAEQILYGLVRKVLAGFKSVPIDATLPRGIRVRGDHAFVEFSSEAVAGIFLDAYRADASVLQIGGEQLLAARSMQRMRMDIQLQRAVSDRFQNQSFDPNDVFFLGNVPSEWQNEEMLASHLGILLEGFVCGNSRTSSRALSVYTFPKFLVAYVHVAGTILADAFFFRCFSHREHMEAISTCVLVCRNSAYLPRAARVSLDH